MNIWNVDNKDSTSLLLWRTEKSTFRVVQDGEYKPILRNGNYIIVNKIFEAILRQMPGQVIVQDAIILDDPFQTGTAQYIELNILNEIAPSSIQTETSTGCKIWHYNGHIFVSGELKDELNKIGGDDLTFTAGFSHFA